MGQYIRCDKLNSVFKVEQWEETVKIFGYNVENESKKLNLFSITLDQFDNDIPSWYIKSGILKEILPTLIEQLKNDNECVIQFYGMLYEGALPECFPFILTAEGGKRYYFPEFSYDTFEKGYIDGWFSFDFLKETLIKIPILQSNADLQGFIIDPNFHDTYNTFHKQRWSYENMESLLKSCVVYFSTDHDFEYFCVASKFPMETIVKKWEEAFKNFEIRDRQDKDELYCLIENYLNKNLNVKEFSESFTRTYVKGTNFEELTKIEHDNFSELNKFTDQFSPDEEMVQNYGYYNEAQVRDAAEKARENLKRGKLAG